MKDVVPAFVPPLVTALILASCLGVLPAPSRASTVWVSHAPILISGNAGFTSGQGVTRGTGTPTDPYVIEGWDIEQSGAYGISIENTDASFVVRNVSVHSPDHTGLGIELTNVTNGRLENSSVANNAVGVLFGSASNVSTANLSVTGSTHAGYTVTAFSLDGVVLPSKNITIAGGTVAGNGEGVRIDHGSNVTLRDGDFSGNGNGSIVWYTEDLRVERCNFSSETGSGMETHFAERLVVSFSQFRHDQNGLFLYNSTNATLRANVIGPNQFFGVYLTGSDFARILNNTVDANPYGGIATMSSFDLVAANNTITRNGLSSLHFDIRQEVRIVDNTIQDNRAPFAGTYGGVGGGGAGRLVFARNRLINNSGGLYASGARDVVVRDNVIEGIDGDGIDLSSVGNVTIEGNVVTQAATGIAMSVVGNVTLSANSVTRNRESGINLAEVGGETVVCSNNAGWNGVNGVDLAAATDALLMGNNVSFNGRTGLSLSSSSGALVYGNTVLGNGFQASDWQGTGNRWNTSYPTGGNYWGDYTGPDQFQGPEQNVPGSDGIGDLPYAVGSGDLDQYPFVILAKDTSPPTVSISSPQPGSDLPSQTVLVTGSATDAFWSGVKRVELRIDGGTWMAANGTSTWAIRASVPYGLDLLEARAWDHGGNPSAIASVTVTYRDRAPVAAISMSPAAGNVTTVFVFDASPSTDAEDPSSALLVRWDWTGDGVWDTNFSATQVASHVFPLPGSYATRLEVRDTQGGTGNATVQVRVAPDATPPTVQVERPQDVALESPILVTANVSDPNGVAAVYLFYRAVGATAFVSVPMLASNDGRYRGSIPAQGQSGDVAFYVTANDTSGNEARSPAAGFLTVRVEASPAAIPLLVPVLGGGGLVVAVVLAVWDLRRRRKGADGRPPGNP